MINDILNKIKSKSATEVQFRLGHRTLIKNQNEWVELDHENLSLSEWEDLKDLCLENAEKLTLETKGFVRAIYQNKDQQWSLSISEYRDSHRAYFSLVLDLEVAQSIQSTVFWDKVKIKKGLYLFVGEQHQGKTALLKNILSEIKKDSPRLMAVHGHSSSMVSLNMDSVVFLNEDSLNWDYQHPIYDGIDIIVVDFNAIANWEKWIKFAEEGRCVFVTLSASSVGNSLDQIITKIGNSVHYLRRFYEVLSLVCYQKLTAGHESGLHEILVMHDSFKKLLLENDFSKLMSLADKDILQKNYLSINQSIIQNLVRRKIDIKTAFKSTPHPDDLDQQLKKMGL